MAEPPEKKAMKYVVVILWPNLKETRYLAPSTATSKERAALEVALVWHADFLKGGWELLRVEENWIEKNEPSKS